MVDGEHYLDIRRAARVAEVSPRTVRRWIDEGKLRKYRVPASGYIRVAQSDLIFLCQPVSDDDNVT